mgnify:FL=1
MAKIGRKSRSTLQQELALKYAPMLRKSSKTTLQTARTTKMVTLRRARTSPVTSKKKTIHSLIPRTIQCALMSPICQWNVFLLVKIRRPTKVWKMSAWRLIWIKIENVIANPSKTQLTMAVLTDFKISSCLRFASLRSPAVNWASLPTRGRQTLACLMRVIRNSLMKPAKRSSIPSKSK